MDGILVESAQDAHPTQTSPTPEIDMFTPTMRPIRTGMEQNVLESYSVDEAPPSPPMSDGNDADNEEDFLSVASSDDLQPPTPTDIPAFFDKGSDMAVDEMDIVPFDMTESVAVVVSYAFFGKAKLIDVSSGSELSSTGNSPNISRPASRWTKIAYKRRLGTVAGTPPANFKLALAEATPIETQYNIGDLVPSAELAQKLPGSRFSEVDCNVEVEAAPALPERSRNRLSGLFLHPVPTNTSASIDVKPKARPAPIITPVTDLSGSLPSPPLSPFWKSTKSTLVRTFSLSHREPSTSTPTTSQPSPSTTLTTNKRKTRAGLHLSTHIQLSPHAAASALIGQGKKLRKRRRVTSDVTDLQSLQSSDMSRSSSGTSNIEARAAAMAALQVSPIGGMF